MSQEITNLVDATIKKAIEGTSPKDLTPDKINAIARLINTRNRLVQLAQMKGARPGIADEDPNLHGDPVYIDKLFAECKHSSPKGKSRQ
jgi:hypothetical protein